MLCVLDDLQGLGCCCAKGVKGLLVRALCRVVTNSTYITSGRAVLLCVSCPKYSMTKKLMAETRRDLTCQMLP